MILVFLAMTKRCRKWKLQNSGNIRLDLKKREYFQFGGRKKTKKQSNKRTYSLNYGSRLRLDLSSVTHSGDQEVYWIWKWNSDLCSSSSIDAALGYQLWFPALMKYWQANLYRESSQGTVTEDNTGYYFTREDEHSVRTCVQSNFTILHHSISAQRRVCSSPPLFLWYQSLTARRLIRHKCWRRSLRGPCDLRHPLLHSERVLAHTPDTGQRRRPAGSLQLLAWACWGKISLSAPESLLLHQPPVGGEEEKNHGWEKVETPC